MTIQLTSKTALFTEPESKAVIVNKVSGWTELFNKQTSTASSTFLRYGALVMPPTEVTMLPATEPSLTFITEQPLSPDSVQATVEIIDDQDQTTLGALVVENPQSSVEIPTGSAATDEGF